jgi:hypothetical protein
MYKVCGYLGQLLVNKRVGGGCNGVERQFSDFPLRNNVIVLVRPRLNGNIYCQS